MTQRLFLFTLSPVQSFIAQARKMRDLQGGSALLSGLIQKAIQSLKEKDPNLEVIYPNEKIESKPNRILAKTSLNETDLKEVADVVRKAYQKISEEQAEGYLENPSLKEKFLSQIQSLLEIQWASVELVDYKESYKALGKHLASLKQYRGFTQTKEIAARKCSLCGERNALFYLEENKNKPRYIDEEASEVSGKHKSLFTLGESICGVCFVKRTFDTKTSFDSTAWVASANLLQVKNQDSNGKKDKIETYIKSLENYKNKYSNDFDAQLLYSENLTKKYFEKHGLKNHISNLKTLEKDLSQIFKQAKELNLKQSSYYATILFDGDNMGKVLSGEFLKAEKQNDLENFHKELSSNLGEFAKACKAHLNSHLGQTIYAGGDDFLGLVNLTTLYDTLEKFLNLFNEKVNQKLQDFLEDGKALSFSCGIGIAHYKTPLSEVLKITRQMEKKAKQNPQKASFSMAVMKHSGDINSFTMKWKENDIETIDVMRNLTNLLKEEVLSNTFIKQLQVEFLPLVNSETKGLDSQLLEIELERLILRSTNSKEQNTNVQTLLNNLKQLFTEKKPQDFFNMLNIADFLHRQV